MFLLLALACAPSLPDPSGPAATDDTAAQADTGQADTAAPDDSGGAGETADSAQEAGFAEVFSLLVSRCASCHEDSYIPSYIDSQDAAATYAMLTDQTPRTGGGDPYVMPGDPAGSLLYEKILPDPAEGTIMPPPTSREDPLTDDEVALIQRWIAAGAEGP